MKLSGKFWKTDETSLETQFCENQPKYTFTKIWKKFRKIFGELSVNYRQTAGDSFLNKYSTILVSHFLQV